MNISCEHDIQSQQNLRIVHLIITTSACFIGYITASKNGVFTRKKNVFCNAGDKNADDYFRTLCNV